MQVKIILAALKDSSVTLVNYAKVLSIGNWLFLELYISLVVIDS